MGASQNNRIRIPTAIQPLSLQLFHYRADSCAAGEMSDMGTHHRVRKPASVFIPWLFLALYLVSICRGDVRDFVTQDFFNIIVSGDVPLSVEGITTQDFFNEILSTVTDGCPGKSFYKYNDFIDAANLFSGFGKNGTVDDNKREIAAFFAHVAFETFNLCYIQEVNTTYMSNYCDTKYPCAAGKRYYGRGPLFVFWNYNYGAAGDYLGVDLLNNPDLVAQNDSISWKTALWFWNVNSNCHRAMTSGQGFQGTLKAVNGDLICSGGSSQEINNRINNYIRFCSQLGVGPGYNVAC